MAKALAKPARDLFVQGEASASPVALTKAKQLVQELFNAQSRLDAISSEAEIIRGRTNHLKTILIPDALKQAGTMVYLDTAIDKMVEVEPFVSGSLPKEEKERATAIALLDQYGGGSLLRTMITLDFSREDRELALEWYNKLKKQNSLNITIREDVHSATYLAYLRERLETGKPINTKVLGVFVGETTKFKKVKAKKGKTNG
jgi:hypothetical protein